MHTIIRHDDNVATLWQFEESTESWVFCETLDIDNVYATNLNVLIKDVSTRKNIQITNSAELALSALKKLKSALSAFSMNRRNIYREYNNTQISHEMLYKIKREIVPFGKYQGFYFDNVPVGYVVWAEKKLRVDGEDLTPECRIFFEDLIRKRKRDILPPPQQNFVGEINEKITCDCTVVTKRTYSTLYGYFVVVTLQDDENNSIVIKNPKFETVEGVKIRISGVVSAHETFRGQKRTIITKAVKLI